MSHMEGYRPELRNQKEKGMSEEEEQMWALLAENSDVDGLHQLVKVVSHSIR